MNTLRARRTIAVQALMLVLVACVPAAAAGRQAVTGPGDESITALRRQAQDGDTEAQYRLALRYRNAQGVPRNLSEAANWFRTAAAAGHAAAQHDLGFMYEVGHLPRDYAEAARWYRLAADQGYPPAQVSLAALYEVGHGVPQDLGEAAKWLQAAAERGSATAQHNIGFLYETGRGVPTDYARAASWYRQAAEQGLAEAQFTLADMYRRGRGVQRDDSEAFKWLSLCLAGSVPPTRNLYAVTLARLSRGMSDAQRADGARRAEQWVAASRKRGH